jgi:hypothetical protein
MALATYNQEQQQPQETFLQRQQRVYGTPTAQQPAQGQQSSTSPVSSTGRITADTGTSGAVSQLKSGTTATQQQTTQQQPAQQQQPAPQPMQTYQGQQGAPTNFVQGPAGGYAVYTPQTQAPVAGAYNPGTQHTYQAAQVQQFQQPQQQQMDASAQALVQGMYANPYSMSQQTVDQMKQGQSEQALAMQKQMLAQLGSQAASRGIDPTKGWGQMQQRQVMQDTMGQILAGNRDIDIQKAQKDRQDLIQALQAGGDWQNSSLGRAVSAYNTQLGGQEAQRSQDLSQIETERAAAQLGMDAQQRGFSDAMAAAQFGAGQEQAGFQSLQQAQQADLNRQFQNAGLMRQDTGNELQAQQIRNQASQFGQTFGLDRERWDYQKQQDAAQAAAAAAAAASADDRWADQMAMQYQQQQMDQYNALLQAIMGGE